MAMRFTGFPYHRRYSISWRCVAFLASLLASLLPLVLWLTEDILGNIIQHPNTNSTGDPNVIASSNSGAKSMPGIMLAGMQNAMPLVNVAACGSYCHKSNSSEKLGVGKIGTNICLPKSCPMHHRFKEIGKLPYSIYFHPL